MIDKVGAKMMRINVLELLEETVKKYPEKIALKDVNHEISYQDLLQTVKKIATYILNNSSQHNQPIAVCIDRNIESIIMFLGVAYSGNFYVPLDTTMPSERIAIILDDLSPIMILSSASQKVVGYETISYDRCLNETIDEELVLKTRERIIDTDPLYAIYTSGSTGRPKGVLISHRGVIDLVEQFKITFPFPENPVFGNQAPYDFDVSVKDIYNALHLGGTVVVIPKQYFSMPLKLMEFLNSEKVNTIIWAVSAMRIVENFKTFAKDAPRYLQLIMFSGEIMPVRVLNYWKKQLPSTIFVNLYGPTEITCNCSYYIVNRDFGDEEAIPIGKAFRNSEVFLLDSDKKIIVMDKDVQGEICVRGTCLAHGYYNDWEKTKMAFIQNPVQQSYPERIYKTGDIGYYNGLGELCFASRKDYQIKHMGHRIELGEIEIVVNAITGIDAAVCIFDEKKEKIVLCFQCNKKADSEIIKKSIIEKLRKKLPKFMWPNRYLCYNELPLNKNGKIDRVLLKKSIEEE